MARYFSDTTEIFRAVIINNKTGNRSYRGPYDSPGKASSQAKQEINRAYRPEDLTWEVERAETKWDRIYQA